MDVKLLLQDTKKMFQDFDNEVSALEETIKILKSCEESCTAQITDMPRGSKVSDKTDTIVNRILLEDKLSDKKKLKTISIFRANHIISSLPESKHRTIFMKYYLTTKTWKEVAGEVGYCYSRCQDYHREGIKYLRKNYKLLK